MKFLESLPIEEFAAIEKEAMTEIYDMWVQSKQDEGDDYLENQIVYYGGSPLQREAYNKFYNLTEEDEDSL